MTTIKYTLRFVIWLIIYVIPTVSLFNNTRIESAEDLSFLQQIAEFAKWEEQNLYQRPADPPKLLLQSKIQRRQNPPIHHSLYQLSNNSLIVQIW